MMLRRSAFLLILLLTACQPAFLVISIPATIQSASPQPSPTSGPTVQFSLTPTPTETLLPSQTPKPYIALPPTVTPLPATLGLDPADWKHWPVIPIVPEHARQIYLLGQSLGNDPHAFSVFGDCNSVPDIFLGIYENGPQAIAALSLNLRETVAWFSGSFNRESPTVRAGTTTGALLWTQWHQNKYTCTVYESPITCELRIHKPSFVIIQVGSHYEARNEGYMRIILDQLIAAGVIPILATKADDIDPDEHVNTQYAQLAVDYILPFWNFWAAVETLPKRGLYSRPEDSYQGGLYLTDEAVAIHRLTALQALDTVRRAVTGGR